MKHLSFCLLIFISAPLCGQKSSVDPFPEVINDASPYDITSPSMNGAENRLCFKKSLSETSKAVMISDQAADGKWSEPYAAAQFGEADIFYGCGINTTGDEIYIGLNNDIYRIEYVGGKEWSKPQLVSHAISMEGMEVMPSIANNNQTLSFVRNLRMEGTDDWKFAPFVSQRTGTEWSKPQEITIDRLDNGEELNIFYYDGKNVFFTSGSSRNNWGNYYGVLQGAVCVQIKKIDFKGGYITWVNKDHTAGLIITATQPSRIARIKFQGL
jgi:hypothetical protein